MKIRIKDNSVRFRLTRSEVAELGTSGILTQVTEFASNIFKYSVMVKDVEELLADFVDNNIILYMPKSMVDALVNTGKVGFSGQAGAVKLLIEKDFVCIDNTDEDQSDQYPNPKMTC